MSLGNALDFSDKRVLVCGGSDGIGYGVATAFHQAGAKVSVTGTKKQGQYDNDFAAFNFYRPDVRNEAEITSLAQRIDTLDSLVNCVGAVLWKKGEFERQGFEQILSINLSGAMQLCTEFYDHLVKTQGSIVHLDSVV